MRSFNGENRATQVLYDSTIGQFDTRLLYWDAQYGLLNRPRAEYKSHLIEGNLWLSAAQHLRKGETETQAYFTHNLASYHLIERGALWFPAWLHDEGLALDGGGAQRRPNLADALSATWTAWAWAWRTCSTTPSLSSTIPPTGRPTLAR